MENTFGASFSLHRCSELRLDKKEVLKAALDDLGLRRFRLMSYWNIHESKPSIYNFDELDWQLDMVAEYGGKVSLCIGKRQPRWPECHMPEWARELSKDEWYSALYAYIRVVVERYKDHPALESWQLENEALLKSFGYCSDQDYSHKRLQNELEIIKSIDPNHAVIMTLSDSWGIPCKQPTPDIFAMSLYRITINKKGRYAYSKRPALFYRIRGHIISLFKKRPVFIHEMQAEPWLHTSLSDVPVSEQLEYMNAEIFSQIAYYALATKLQPIDLWGLEWWYWLKTKHHNDTMWAAVKDIILKT